MSERVHFLWERHTLNTTLTIRMICLLLYISLTSLAVYYIKWYIIFILLTALILGCVHWFCHYWPFIVVSEVMFWWRFNVSFATVMLSMVPSAFTFFVFNAACFVVFYFTALYCCRQDLLTSSYKISYEICLLSSLDWNKFMYSIQETFLTCGARPITKTKSNTKLNLDCIRI